MGQMLGKSTFLNRCYAAAKANWCPNKEKNVWKDVDSVRLCVLQCKSNYLNQTTFGFSMQKIDCEITEEI